jgi:hypothetical protein
MYRTLIINCVALSFTFQAAFSEQSLAEPILLIEIHNTGFRNLTSGQPEMGFSFDVGVQESEWLLFATRSDIGRTFSAPAQLLPIYDERLTTTEDIIVELSCCEGSEHDLFTPDLNFDKIDEFTMVNRVAPNLGPNLAGYLVTEVIQTIDDITITPVPGSGGLFNRSGAHTVRIYGEVIPEPSTIVISLLGLLLSIVIIKEDRLGRS